MNKELERIINTYEINELKNDLESAETVDNIFIGVLGEFSSGKSSMLNSILGKKVLPAMDKPTTKSITYIKSNVNQDDEIEYFEVKEDDTEEKISLIDFQDIAKGSRKGETVVSVKSNEFLNNGYVFIDTPGVSSLDQTDIDITYGLLPKLDGILICIDCNTGSLNASLKSFLESPEIELIKTKIVFLLTKSDQKTDESMAKIIEGFKKDINHYLKVDDMDNRIVSFSSQDVLQNGNKVSVDNLLHLFGNSINERRKQMQDLRLKKQEESLKLKIKDALKDLKNKLSFDESQFKSERTKLEADIESLHTQKSELKKKLAKFEDKLFDEIKEINKSVSSKIVLECANVTPDEAKLSVLYNQYIEQATSLIGESVARFFKDYNFVDSKSLNIDFSELSSSVNAIIKTKDQLTGLVTAIAIAAATAGTSAAANAAETAAGSAAKEAGQAAVKNVATKTIAVNTAKEVGKTVVKQSLKQSLKTKLISGLAIALQGAKEINPIEHLGAFLANKTIAASLDVKLNEIGRKICNKTLESIEVQIEDVFNGIDERLKIHENNLDVAFEKKKQGKSEVENLKSNIDIELINLG
jgi:GTPase Era involved in 16S rRNA processing